MEEKLEKGGFCLVAMDGERMAGFNLVAFGEVYIPLLKMTKKLREGEAWSEQITVLKSYRRRNLASDIRSQVFNELKRKGFRELYGGTLRSNNASLGLARKVGFKEITDVHYRSILGSKKLQYEDLQR